MRWMRGGERKAKSVTFTDHKDEGKKKTTCIYHYCVH